MNVDRIRKASRWNGQIWDVDRNDQVIGPETVLMNNITVQRYRGVAGLGGLYEKGGTIRGMAGESARASSL